MKPLDSLTHGGVRGRGYSAPPTRLCPHPRPPSVAFLRLPRKINAPPGPRCSARPRRHRPQQPQINRPKTSRTLSKRNIITCRREISEIGLVKVLCPCYNTAVQTSAQEHRGVEQLEARRAHNPEVVGSSPASATIKTPDFDKKSGVFLTFWRKMER